MELIRVDERVVEHTVFGVEHKGTRLKRTHGACVACAGSGEVDEDVVCRGERM